MSTTSEKLLAEARAELAGTFDPHSPYHRFLVDLLPPDEARRIKDSVPDGSLDHLFASPVDALFGDARPEPERDRLFGESGGYLRPGPEPLGDCRRLQEDSRPDHRFDFLFREAEPQIAVTPAGDREMDYLFVGKETQDEQRS